MELMAGSAERTAAKARRGVSHEQKIILPAMSAFDDLPAF